MMTQAPKRRLGRGLAALIGDDATEAMETGPATVEARGLKTVPIEHIHPNPHNPRRHFAAAELEDLANSIREKGLLQPLMVRPRSDGDFEIVAGERRWRAAQIAGVHELQVLVKELSDGETLEIALIENIQRADLNPLEEARAYRQLMEEFQYTQAQLAQSVGKSRSHIANTLRLQTLPPAVLELIEKGELTAGHARALVATESPEALAQKIVALGLSVREAEGLVKDQPEKRKAGPRAEKDADTRAFEKNLSDALGLHVTVHDRGGKGGTLSISYKTLDQLDDIARKLTR